MTNTEIFFFIWIAVGWITIPLWCIYGELKKFNENRED